MYDVKLCTIKCKDSKAIYIVIKVRMGCLLERTTRICNIRKFKFWSPPLKMVPISLHAYHLFSAWGICASAQVFSDYIMYKRWYKYCLYSKNMDKQKIQQGFRKLNLHGQVCVQIILFVFFFIYIILTYVYNYLKKKNHCFLSPDAILCFKSCWDASQRKIQKPNVYL